MIITKKWLKKYCEKAWIIDMNKEQEKQILKRFGEEPGDGYVWTEEDICIQIRNIMSGRPPIS